MRLGLYTDSVPDLEYVDALDLAVEVGARSLEIAAGGMSAAPHLDLERLVRDRSARSSWIHEQTTRGLDLAALNCSAWLLHPVRGADSIDITERAMQLAGLLGVDKVVTMSGLPGDGPAATTSTWSWSTWPLDAVDLRERQWDEAIRVWDRLVSRARVEGIRRIALELHPWQLVYNIPTLQRLRDAVGIEIGANLDPSHLLWQGMDPVLVANALGDALHHVHLKDTTINPANVAIHGVLDHTPTPADRAWVFSALGQGHGIDVWDPFFAALDRGGYDDVLSIENEDPWLPGSEGVRVAADFARARLELRAGR